MFKKQTDRKRAFTLVELLIVIIIIAVLAAIAIPKFSNSSQRSKESALRAELSLLRNAVELFKTDTGAFPATLAALEATAAPASGLDSAGAAKAIIAADWKGPYVNKVNNDPVSAAAFTYGTTSPNVGKITSSASGNGLDGTAFSSW
jgi:general secretion pathway protein G